MTAETTLVLGAGGFVGSNLAISAKQSGSVVRHTRRPLPADGKMSIAMDLTSFEDLGVVLEQTSPSLVVNCVALADVDRCERERDVAFWLNAELPGIVAAACASRGIDLVHISTDAVFGSSDQIHCVDDPTSPVNHYGVTKAEGEARVMAALPSAIVARTNVVGWSPTRKRSLLEFFYDNLTAGRRVVGFTDVHFRPISVLDLWHAILGWVAEVRLGHQAGLRHAVGDTLLTKYEFGLLVAEVFGLNGELIDRGSARSAGLEADRAHTLDLLPSPLPASSARPWWPVAIRDGLGGLRDAASAGLRERLAASITTESPVGALPDDS